MSRQLNIGIIGTSDWTDFAYLDVFQNYNRANIVAICGRNHKRAGFMAQKYNIPEVYSDYQQMIDQADIDAVVVSTPDDTHYEMVMAALDARKHILCEKPTALNAKHALEMYQKAESVGVKHMVMYTWYWLPNMQKLKQLIDEGYTGTIYNGYFQWLADGWRNNNYAWRFDADRSNGILGDLGSHLLHMAIWLLGDVIAVTARLSNYIQHEGANGGQINPANDTVSCILEFTNGAQIQIFVTGVALNVKDGNQITVRLHGENGTIQTDFNPAYDMLLNTTGQQADGEIEVIHSQKLDLETYYRDEPIGVRYFTDCVLDDKPIIPSLYDGYKVQQLIDAILLSHKSGKRVIIESTE